MSSQVPKVALVAGGCGFIGSNFINYMFDVWPTTMFINVDKLILNSDVTYVDPHVATCVDRYKLVTSDIRNHECIAALLEQHQVDTVIHFAADCTSTRCYADPVEAVENNVIAHVSLLETCKQYGKLKQFIHISTDEVYGDSGLGIDEKGKEEEARLAPGNPYAATKAAAEAYSHCYATSLPLIIVRINNIYGPNQWNVKLVPRFIEMARSKTPFPVQGTGQQLRSWLHVNDASEGIRAIVERGKLGQTYNLGTYFEMNVLDLAHAVQAEVDKQMQREPHTVAFASVPDRPYNDLRYLLDISKAYRELDWQPRISFDEGLARVVTSALAAKPCAQRMTVALYGGGGWIGRQLQAALTARGISCCLASARVGRDSDATVLDELVRLAATHVLCATGRTHGGGIKTIEYLEGGPDRLNENIRDNLYCVITLASLTRKLGIHFTYVGTGYLFAYDQHEHTIGGKPFTETDLPTFFGNSYSVVKGFTDRMMRQYQGGETINARITLPLNFAMNEERNLLAKLVFYRQIFDIPVSITILPDCIPVLLKLMERRFGGCLNLVNPGPISLHEVLQLYKQVPSVPDYQGINQFQYVDPKLADYEVVGTDSDKGRQLLATKGNCALSTALLSTLEPEIPSAHDSLRQAFIALAPPSQA